MTQCMYCKTEINKITKQEVCFSCELYASLLRHTLSGLQFTAGNQKSKTYWLKPIENLLHNLLK